MRRTIALVAALLASGCVSYAGPFVTNIAPAGNGLLTVEKCKVAFTDGPNTVSMGECYTTTIDPRAAAAPVAAPATQAAPVAAPAPAQPERVEKVEIREF